MLTRPRPIARFFSKAVHDAKEALGVNGKLLGAALSIAFTVLILYGWDIELAWDEVRVYVAGAGGFALGFGVLFVFLLLAAPSRLLIDADREIDTLRDIVNRRDEIHDILLELARLRESGIVIRNRPIQDSEFREWLNEYNRWNSAVTFAANRLSLVEGKLIEVLGEISAIPVGGIRYLQGAHGEEHARAVAILTAKTNRIRELVGKYSDIITRLNLIDTERVRAFLQDWR